MNVRQPDEDTLRAMARLLPDAGFRKIIEWLEGERDHLVMDLLHNLNTVQTHQLQGCSRTLVEILQTIVSAPDVLRERQAQQAS
jgi:Mg2+ and Co2+ transporter CorA